jgi:CheY-like chemotaxis protein
MVVDDEEFNLDIIATFFRILDLDLKDDRITYCRDGEQALNIIKDCNDKGRPLEYSLILSDC